MPASTYQQQKLRVCDVCSAYLGLHDNDTRLADHFAGKLHLGFIEIREQHQKLKASAACYSRLHPYSKYVIAFVEIHITLFSYITYITRNRMFMTRVNRQALMSVKE